MVHSEMTGGPVKEPGQPSVPPSPAARTGSASGPPVFVRPRYAATLTMDQVREIQRALTQVPWLVRELELQLTRQTAGGGEKAGGRSSGEKPMPFDDSAAVAIRRLTRVLSRWAGKVDTEGYSQSMVKNADRLLDNLGDLFPFPLAHNEITAAVENAVEVIDKRRDRIFLGDCPSDGSAIYGDPEEVWAECPRCNLRVDVEAVRSRNIQRGQNMLATAEMARRYIGEVEGIQLRPSRVKVWASRGYFIKRGEDSQGRSLYRLGDIVAHAKAQAAAQDAPRKIIRGHKESEA